MGWWKKKGEGGRSTLEKLAREAEAIALAMPPDAQAEAMRGIGTIAEGIRQLFALPPELVNVLWKLLCCFVAFSKLPGVKEEQLLEDIARGLPELDRRYGIATAIRMLVKERK